MRISRFAWSLVAALAWASTGPSQAQSQEEIEKCLGGLRKSVVIWSEVHGKLLKQKTDAGGLAYMKKTGCAKLKPVAFAYDEECELVREAVIASSSKDVVTTFTKLSKLIPEALRLCQL